MAGSLLISSGDLTASGNASVLNASILNIGRSINKSGIGLSASARQGLNGFINATQGGYNQMFSLATGPSLSAGGMATQINALRASIPVSQLSPALLEQIAADILAEQEANAVSPSTRGQSINTSA